MAVESAAPGQPAPASWRGEAGTRPPGQSLLSVLHAQRQRRGRALALVECGGESGSRGESEAGRRLTYARTWELAERIAADLLALGVAPGDRVATLLPRGIDLVLAQLGILRVGAAYLPLDPADPPRRLRVLLEEADAAAVVHAGGLAHPGRRRSDRGGRLLGLPALDLAARDPAAPNPAAPDPAAPATTPPPPLPPLARFQAEDPAYVMFTSGTTGRPKGVVVPHRAVLRLVLDGDFARFGPDQRWLVLAPPAFDASTLELWAPLLHGGRAVILRQARPTLDDIGRTIRDQRVTAAWLTASLFNVVIDEAPGLLTPLQQLLIGGETLSPAHVRRALERFPDLHLVNGYGPTENTTFTCCHPIRPDDCAGPIPIGRPIAGTTVHVVDEGGQPVPVGQAGELWTGGQGVALGYLGRPDETAERFPPDPWSDRPGARLYRTGDRARWRPDGRLEFLGRVDDQLKLHGHRIEPGEVERVLVEHPAVLRVAVAAPVGPRGPRLTAFVVPVDAGQPPSAQDLQAWLAERLPGWLVPSRFVVVPALPLLPSGKVDRAALLAQAPAADIAPTADKPAPRRDSVQALLTELLGHAPDWSRSFCSQGGDSLAALVLSARLGGRPEPAELLAARSLGELFPGRDRKRRQDQAAAAGQVPQPGEGEGEGRAQPGAGSPPHRPASPEQTALWVEEQRGTAAGAYNETFCWRIEGAVDDASLVAALDQLVARHPALRTRLAPADDGLVQQVPPPHPFPLDQPGRPADDALRRRVALAPFDLAVDAPCRGLLAPLPRPDGPDGRLLQLTFHHSAVDDRSLEILFAELGALLAGLPLPPPAPTAAPLATPSPDATRWWQEQLAGARLGHGLPSARPGSATEAGRIPIVLPPATTAALHARARAGDCTPFVLTATLFQLLLARRGDRPTVTIATPLSTRRGPLAWDRVGYHLQTVLLPARLPEHGVAAGATAAQRRAAFDAGVQHTRSVLLGAMHHQGVRTSELLAMARPPGGALPRLDTVIVHRPGADPSPTAPGLRFTPLPPPAGPPKFDLTLWLEPRGDEIRGHLEHRRGAIDDQVARSLAEGFVALAAELLPGLPSRTLPLPSPLPFRPAPAPAAAAQAPPDPQLVVALTRLWAQVLHQDQAHADSDFFALGGDSVAAISLLARIQRTLGATAALPQLFAAPTPRRFAAALAPQEPAPARPDPARHGAVVLAPGVDPPLFFVGQPFLFQRIAGRLATPRACLGLDLPPATGSAHTRSLPAMAVALADQVAVLQPDGPVDLVGYSVGGNVAYELACQLRARGRDVASLTLVDAFVPDSVQQTPLARRTLRYVVDGLRKGPGGGLAVIQRGLQRRLRWWQQQRAEDRGQALPAEEDPGAAYDAHLRRALLALEDWRPAPFDGGLTLLRAARSHVGFRIVDDDGGWGPSTAGPVVVMGLDCDHLGVFEPEHLPQLVACLDRLYPGEARR